MRTAITQARRSGSFVGLKDLVRPQQLPSLAAWYDISDLSSLIYDGSNRVALVSDKSGNSDVNVLALNGVAGNGASTPNLGASTLTGDMSFICSVALDSVAPAGFYVFGSQQPSVGQFNWEFYLSNGASGLLKYNYSTDGTTTVIKTASATLASAGLKAFSRIYLGVLHDVDNGAGGNDVKFYYSTNGTAWTQLGTTQTTAGAVTRHASTGQISIGCAALASLTNPVSGLVYSAGLYSGDYFAGSGTLVFDADFSTAAKLATSFTESSTNAATVTINTSGATGARISGARDLYQGVVANQPVLNVWSGTNYGFSQVSSGNYFSTPNASGVQATSDIDIKWFGALNDYTPSGQQVFFAKWFTAGQLSYFFDLVAAGPRFFMTIDGSTTIFETSSAAPVVTDRANFGFRVTRTASDGVVTFYTSPDGITWNQLGTTKTLSVGNNIFNGTSIATVGATNTLSASLDGVTHWASISKTIGGAATAYFNPALYTSGTTFTASTGETWTLNGGATIVTRTSLYFDGSNDYLKAAAFGLPQPVSRYTVASQVSWTSGDYLWDGASAANRAALIQTTSTPQLNLNAGSSVAANTGLVLQTISVIAEVFNGAASFLTIARQAATTGNAGAGAPNGVTIGASGAATAANFGNITFSEQLIYSAAHGTNFSLRILMWLWRKWKPTFNI